MHTTTITQTLGDRLLADLDGDMPAKVKRPARLVTPDDTVTAIPDFFEDGFAVFIGADATVLVEEHALLDLSLRVARGSILARTGHFPVEQGIVVRPHTGVLSSPTYGAKHHEAQVAWRLAQDTLTVPTA